MVDEAKHAVGNIKPEALSEIRSLRMPPDVIRDILEGVLRLMGIFDTSWVSMKRSEGKDTPQKWDKFRDKSKKRIMEKVTPHLICLMRNLN